MFEENRKRINAKMELLRVNRLRRNEREMLANRQIRMLKSRQSERLEQLSRIDNDRLIEKER